MTTDIHQPTNLPTIAFTREEALKLETMRARYQQDHDLFSERERAHLLFLRWCVRSGRLSELIPLPSEKETLGGL